MFHQEAAVETIKLKESNAWRGEWKKETWNKIKEKLNQKEEKIMKTRT